MSDAEEDPPVVDKPETQHSVLDDKEESPIPPGNILFDKPETQNSNLADKQIVTDSTKPTPNILASAEPLPKILLQDSFTLEFIYYGSVLKTALPTLSSDKDKNLAAPWINKLLRPEYQTTMLREKRNKYLVSLILNLLNDDIDGVFKNFPLEGALPDIEKSQTEPLVAADWETDTIWHDTLQSMPGGEQTMKCSVHNSKDQCAKDHKLDRVLDQEFQFLLYLARPYAAMLLADDRSRAAMWLQALCTIYGESCSSMKSIRNDYITTLLGYLRDLRVVGPFTDYPPTQLERLDVAAEKWAKNQKVLDLESWQIDSFLSEQPVPDDGAFCYVVVTGDLIAASM